METLRLSQRPKDIAQAGALLRAGHCVALPTETVYGLGADATNADAVAGIYAAKGRPAFNPLIVHLAVAAQAGDFAEVSEVAARLMAAFWPGPLTLVLPRRADCALAPAVSAGLGSVAMRVPDHPVARALLAASGLPLAAPSANPSGGVSPTRAAHVVEGLSGRIAAVVDGGACAVGLESTVLSLVEDVPRLLRPGAVTRQALEAALGRPVAEPADEEVPSAPGQLSSHYAPRARVVLEARARPAGALWLGFGPESAGADETLSATGDLAEAAERLFSCLRALDAKAKDGDVIAVAPVPHAGIGAAINDRLKRAAAPRES